MIKSLLILFNFLGFLVLNFFFLQKIEVEHTLPEQLAPGESTEVSLTIDKGKIEGFAKLQLNVDRGLSVENIESKGASFTFSDQKAKFIWMSLPEDKQFTIKYRLTADSDAVGALNITGHFSYIDENQRLVHDLTAAKITTGAGEAIAQESADGKDNISAIAQVSRTIESTENGRYRVNLTIAKENLSGFAKLQEIIPIDYTAVAVVNEDAVFNIVDSKVKFVWFDIPDEPNLSVSYDLIPVTNNPTTDLDLDGEFSFLVDNETQTVIVNAPALADNQHETEVETEEAEVSEPEIAEQVEEIEEGPSETDDVEDFVDAEEAEGWEEEDLLNGTEKESSPAEEVAEVSEPEQSETPKETEKTSIPETTEAEVEEPAVSSMPETGISYRVQITAAHKLVDAAYFKAQHQFTGPFKTENHEGWIKYTTGGFDVYRSARDHRNALTASYNFPGPFVTAYNEGERITVQEALMIANQKWVP